MNFHSYVSLPEGIQGKIVKYGQPDIFDWFRPTYWWNSCWIYLHKPIFTLIFMVKIGWMGISPIWGYGEIIGIEWDKSPTTHFFGPKNATRHGSISMGKMVDQAIKPCDFTASRIPRKPSRRRSKATHFAVEKGSLMAGESLLDGFEPTVKHQNSPMFGKPP